MIGRRPYLLFVCLVQIMTIYPAWGTELQVNWSPQFTPDRPGEVVVEGPIPLGDGRYRMSFSAAQPNLYDMSVLYEVVDNLHVEDSGGGDAVVLPVSAQLTLANHPTYPNPILGSGFSGTIGPLTVVAGTEIDLELSVFQLRDGGVVAQFMGDREYTVPSGPNPISFSADIGNDGHFELSDGGAEFEFSATPANDLELVGQASAGGLVRHFQTTFNIVNRPPVLENIAVNLPTSDARQLILLADAYDLDNDTLRYRVRWGDGEEDFFTDALLTHQYSTDGPFEVEITVLDYLDASDTQILPFSFPAFSNQPPIVNRVVELARNGFERTFAIDAQDPESHALTYRVEWGDSSPNETGASPVIKHTFPSQRPATYPVSIWVIDELGQETRYPMNVDFAPDEQNQAPTITGIHVIEKRDGRVVIAVEAFDSDGDTLLTTIDWGDTGVDVDQAGQIFVHDYVNSVDATFRVDVQVKDGRGGVTDQSINIVFEPVQNNDPTQLEVVELSRTNFTWVGSFHAVDTDDDALVYTVDVRDGTDPVVSSGGIVRHAFPMGEYRTYPLLVTAADGKGGNISTTYSVTFLEPQANGAPTVASVTEVIRDDRAVVMKVDVSDTEGHAITLTFDWGDGFVTEDQTTFLASHRYGDDQNQFTLTVTATDELGASSAHSKTIVFDPPPQNQAPVFVDVREVSRQGGKVLLLAEAVDPEDDALRYRWRFDDGSADVETVVPLLEHMFPVDRFGEYSVEVRATDSVGDFTETNLLITIPEPPPNQPPEIQFVYVDQLSQYEALVFVDASDPEDDTLTFRYDWGDETAVFETGVPFASHAYPVDVFRAYPLTVTVSDGASSSEPHVSSIHIVQPPPNEAPVVNDIELVIGTRGQVELRVDAADPEGDLFEIIVDWGDGTSDEETPVLRSGQGQHNYAYRTDLRPYEGQITLIDAGGKERQTAFTVLIPDAPTELHQTDVTLLDDGRVHIAVVASDADVPSQLLHSFDFDGDFVFETPSRLSGNVFYQYTEPGQKQVNLLFTDPWSGQTLSHSISVNVPAWHIEAAEPVIDRVVWTAGPSGMVELLVEISDPDEVVSDVEVLWGDEIEVDSSDRVVNGRSQHRYAYQVEPYSGQVIARTNSGREVIHPFEVSLTDVPTQFGHLSTAALGQGRMFLTGSAFDDDSPLGLTYTIDVGADGAIEHTGLGAIGEVLHFDVPGTYDCLVRVQDGWSGNWTEQTISFDVNDWIGGVEPPTIAELQVVVQPGGVVELMYEIETVDTETIEVAVHWGDETNETVVEPAESLGASHTYANPRFNRLYYGFLEVTSDTGLKSREVFTVALTDASTRIDTINAELLDNQFWRVNVVATDADTSNLRYSFDLFDDGDFEVEYGADQTYFFPHDGRLDVPIRVSVTDPWSDQTISELYTVMTNTASKNLAPEIVDVSVNISAGGQVRLLADARDPNGDRLNLTVDWGDGSQNEVAGQILPTVAHRYSAPNDSYEVVVTVSDGNGENAVETLVLNIQDLLPQDPQLEATQVGEGWILFSAFAFDPDGMSMYAFDVDGDGRFERLDTPVASWSYRYAMSGEYTVKLRITDVWSGVVTELEKTVIVTPWSQAAPIVEDHIALSEGSCLRLQIGQSSQIVADTASDECEAEVEDGSWRWDMGDGTVIQGRAVQHRYVNDGTYFVRVSRESNGAEVQQSVLAILVQNVAPAFSSTGFPIAVAGEVYTSEIVVSDLGLEDELRVNVEEGPNDLRITQETPDTWQLRWDVPIDAEGPHDIRLSAIDGQSSAEGFLEDGGRAVLNFRLLVQTAQQETVESEPILEPEPTIGSLSGGGSGCTVNTTIPTEVLYFTFFFAHFVRRRRRHL